MDIKNKDLSIVIGFLKEEIKATKVDNIHRMRIVKALESQQEKLISEETQLVKEFAVLDDNGNIKQDNNGSFFVTNRSEFETQQKQLLNEVFRIEDKNLSEALKTIKRLVNDFEDQLSGESAEAHFILSEAMENINMEEK